MDPDDPSIVARKAAARETTDEKLATARAIAARAAARDELAGHHRVPLGEAHDA